MRQAVLLGAPDDRKQVAIQRSATGNAWVAQHTLKVWARIIRHVIASPTLNVGAPSLVIAGITRRAMQCEGMMEGAIARLHRELGDIMFVSFCINIRHFGQVFGVFLIGVE